MYLEELIDVVLVAKLCTALLKMLNPVETRVLDLWRKTLLYSTTLYVSHKCREPGVFNLKRFISNIVVVILAAYKLTRDFHPLK
jgi:hypothetical protein